VTSPTTTGTALLLALGVACTSSVLDPAAHVWGTYTACQRRLADDCPGAADGGCRTEAMRARSVTLGHLPDGGFLWSREGGLLPLEGVQAGARFELRATVPGVATLCGCVADVEETIRGELVEAAEARGACEEPDGGGCGPDGGRSSAWWGDTMPGEGWIEEADGGVDVTRSYRAFRAVVTDVATAADAGSCDCLPCRVSFEVSGSR
jgi:hypothetical protein